MYYPVFRHLKSQLKELLVILECDAHKKVSQDLTEKKARLNQDEYNFKGINRDLSKILS